MWCLRNFISGCFAIDGGLLYGGGLKTWSSGYGVFSIAAWAMGASLLFFYLEEKQWD
jgi:hypothetical protein